MARFLGRYREKLASSTTSGKLRVRGGTFMVREQGAFSTKGMKKAAGKGARFRLDHRGFMRQTRALRRISYKGPNYGKGRGYIARPGGYHLSAITRERISIALLNKAHPHKGHVQTATTKAKISASLTAYNKTHPAAVAARTAKSAATRRAKS